MNTNDKRVVLITGASSGIGRACAGHLHQRGYRVYGTHRRTQAAETAVSGEENDLSQPYELIPMDVTSDTSVERGIATVLSREGRIDVVVNNAGYALAGSVEDTSLDEARAQFETNFFGVFRVCHMVLPHMRRQQAGYIVNVSSIAGVIGTPFQGLYSASKFALEGLTEALRMEVKPYHIQVAILEPGNFHTRTTSNRQIALAARENPGYVERFTRALGVIEADELNGPNPMHIAYLLEHIINDPTPRLRYPVGIVFEKFAITLKKVMPARLFEWGFMKYYKLL